MPGITVKTILAGLSLPYIAFLLAKGRNAIVSHDVVTIILFYPTHNAVQLGVQYPQ